MKHFPVFHFTGTSEHFMPGMIHEWIKRNMGAPPHFFIPFHPHISEPFTLKGNWGRVMKALTNFQVLADMNLSASCRTSKSQEYPHLQHVFPQQPHSLQTHSCSAADLSPHNLVFGDCVRGGQRHHMFTACYNGNTVLCFIPPLNLNYRPQGTVLQEST